ncbi:MAG: AAA family ATPase [Dehalococcoidia bacterium]
MADDNGNSGVRGPALILLSGLPGAGKTTFTRALGEAFPCLHIESDSIRREAFPAPRYSPRESAAVFWAVERRAAEALTAGQVAVVDATNLTRRDRARFVRLAARAGCLLVCVRLIAPEPVIRARLAGPREGNSEAGLPVYELMREKAETFRTPVIAVDTRYDIGPSVGLIRRMLKEADL